MAIDDIIRTNTLALRRKGCIHNTIANYSYKMSTLYACL